MGGSLFEGGGPCEICKNPAEYSGSPIKFKRKCPRCGVYSYVSNVATGAQAGWLDVRSPDHMVRLSGWVREQNDAGVERPNISIEISRRTAQMPLPRFQERADQALRVIARRSGNAVRQAISIEGLAKDLELYGRTYSKDGKDIRTLIAILEDEGSVIRSQTGVGLTLAVGGLLKVELLSGRSSNSSQAFVAMSFHPNMNDAWTNGFDPAIRASGFNPFRIDSKDYVGGISDEIVAEIRRSRFVVADYTSQINGVYFEAGFALGLGLTVIPTCKEDEVAKLHFDIKHLNTLLWKSPDDLIVPLSRRIRAVIGSGPHFADEAGVTP